ncbi:DgyrCDS14387 [Dimorphilus gyrociliatus]|nr:DgyrCDS14387 [Dimorphilus gyrociliatus]
MPCKDNSITIKSDSFTNSYGYSRLLFRFLPDCKLDIFVKFKFFHVNYSKNCIKDFLSLRQHSKTAKFCGESFIMNSLGSNTSTEFFQRKIYSIKHFYQIPFSIENQFTYQTDGLSNNRGFIIEIKTKLPKPIMMIKKRKSDVLHSLHTIELKDYENKVYKLSCESESIIIKSLEPYQSIENTSLILRHSPRCKMYFFVRFIEFDVEYSPNCQKDYLLMTQNSNSAKLCGNESSIFNSNGSSKFEGFFNRWYYSMQGVYIEPIVNDIRIVFKTDGSSQRNGFSIEIETSFTEEIFGHPSYCDFL